MMHYHAGATQRGLLHWPSCSITSEHTNAKKVLLFHLSIQPYKDISLIRTFLADKQAVYNDEPLFSCGQAWRMYSLLKCNQSWRPDINKGWYAAFIRDSNNYLEEKDETLLCFGMTACLARSSTELQSPQKVARRLKPSWSKQTV